MEIKSFRIKNYRSIKDSAVCYLSGDNVTILAGKNESGKTAILEALEDFNINKMIREEAISLHRSQVKPEISITFEMNEAELQEIYEILSLKLEPSQPITAIEITKRYPNEYILSEESVKLLGITDPQLLRKLQNQTGGFYTHIKKVHQDLHNDYPQIGNDLPVWNIKDVTIFKAQILDFINRIRANIPQIPSEGKQRSDVLIEAIGNMLNMLTELENLQTIEHRFSDELIKKHVPNFVLFSSFDDVFPSQVSLGEATNNELIKDLDTISDLHLELIRTGSISQRAKHKEQLNIRVKENYAKFWTQDLTHLHIDWDSENIYFLIKEGEFYPPNMRSKGKQWHLAFYIKVTARAREDVSNVILIDEPGLFLHAQAQKDVLSIFEDSAKNTPIIFSTHSPYLINIDALHRIRLFSRITEE